MCAPEGRVMFFLVRSLFWLGLVFMALPWDGASLRDELVGEAQKATQIIVRETQSLCAKDPTLAEVISTWAPQSPTMYSTSPAVSLEEMQV